MKDFFQTIIGGGWYFLILFMLSLAMIFPFCMIGLPIWLIIILIIISLMNDLIGGIIQLIAWIVGLIFTIINPQNWLSIVYYIAFIVVELPTVLRLINYFYNKIRY